MKYLKGKLQKIIEETELKVKSLGEENSNHQKHITGQEKEIVDKKSQIDELNRKLVKKEDNKSLN